MTDKDELVGRLREVSRFPQYLKRCQHFRTLTGQDVHMSHTYLITAMFTGAVVLARYTVVSDIFREFSILHRDSNAGQRSKRVIARARRNLWWAACKHKLSQKGKNRALAFPRFSDAGIIE